MDLDKRVKELAEKISEKINKARSKAIEKGVNVSTKSIDEIKVDEEAIKKVLLKNKNYGLTVKQIKVKKDLERAKQRPGSNYHKLLAKATVEHIKDQKAKENLVEVGNKLAMTKGYRSSGVKEIEDYVCSKCIPVSEA